MDAKKLKLIVRGEKKPTFGTDPNEPWSARVGITESERGMLHAYLKSRGINPEFVSKDTKISHAKSGEFHKWKRDHMFDDPADYVSSVAREKMKAQRAQAEEVEHIEEKNVPTSPEKWARAKAQAKAKFAVYPSAYANGWASKKYKAMGGGWKSVSEGFDNHEEIAKELIRRHGMNVTKDHLRALENERDSHGALDHDEVMNKVRAMGAMTEAKKPKMTALDKFRKAAAEREKKHSQYEKPTGDLKGAIDRLEKHLNKEETGVSKAKETKFHTSLDKLVHKTFGPSPSEKKEKQKMKKEEVELDEGISDFDRKEKSRLFKAKLSSAVSASKPQADKLLARTGMNMAHKFPRKGQTDLGNIPKMNTPGNSPETDAYAEKRRGDRAKELKPAIRAALGTHGPKGKLPEEVEQIDEISKSTLDSYRDKSSASLKNAKMNRDAAEPGKNMSKGFADLHAKSNAIAKKRVKGLMGYLQRKQGVKPMGEDVFQDTQAATQTAFDMGTQADDREPTYSKRKEMSKSARMIKALYKKHKMVKEDLYDHEKEDKSVATYGKKPKVEKQEVYGDDDTQAAMVLKGGTTLTGQTRDTLEIDPVMRKPVKPDSKEKT